MQIEAFMFQYLVNCRSSNSDWDLDTGDRPRLLTQLLSPCCPARPLTSQLIKQTSDKTSLPSPSRCLWVSLLTPSSPLTTAGYCYIQSTKVFQAAKLGNNMVLKEVKCTLNKLLVKERNKWHNFPPLWSQQLLSMRWNKNFLWQWSMMALIRW